MDFLIRDLPHVYDFPPDEKLHVDYYVGDQAEGIIKRRKLKAPWFLWVSFNGPHPPWDPPAKYSEPYKKMDLPVADTYPGEIDTKPSNDTCECCVYTRYIADFMDRHPERRPEMVKGMRAGHYGNLTFIDRQLEKILSVLDEQGELDNTIIIYSADHGSLLGDHGKDATFLGEISDVAPIDQAHHTEITDLGYNALVS